MEDFLNEWGFILFGIFIAIFAAISLGCWLKVKKLIGNGQKVTATVVNHVERLVRGKNLGDGVGSSDYIVFHAIFQYMVDGKIYEKRDSIGKNPSKYRVGDRVTLYYNSKNPEEITKANEERILKIIFFVFVMLAVLFLLIGIFT